MNEWIRILNFQIFIDEIQFILKVNITLYSVACLFKQQQQRNTINWSTAKKVIELFS